MDRYIACQVDLGTSPVQNVGLEKHSTTFKHHPVEPGLRPRFAGLPEFKHSRNIPPFLTGKVSGPHGPAHRILALEGSVDSIQP